MQKKDQIIKVTRKERFTAVIEYFRKTLPEPDTELHYKNPYELIVAVILSAQCTDKRVNIITPDFFSRFPDANKLASASHEEVLSIIRSCSYPNNKSKHLIGMARVLINDFHNKVPEDVNLLQKLPGVGRKSANVIAAVLYKIPVMPVDTHVFRVSSRLGLTSGARTPLQAERQLVKYLPVDLISRTHHWLILHGRYTCISRKPKCEECGLTGICKYYNNKLHKK
ncbi:MAG: endonuclease III [Bacteroides sp. SM23_62_1]|nr:MAG: endonuclease III [Bacteroides sp. SM23_62_1]